MATRGDFERIATTLAGTTSAPHFDRTAFKVARTYATLAPDGLTANIKLRPEQQQLKCLTAPEAFAPVSGAWGRMGWTVTTLAALSVAELRAVLAEAWTDAQPRAKAKPRAPQSKL